MLMLSIFEAMMISGLLLYCFHCEEMKAGIFLRMAVGICINIVAIIG